MPYAAEVGRSWESDPINTYLKYKNPTIPLVDLLVEGHRIQCELERIFPEMTISEIFKLPETPATGDQAAKVRKVLKDLGYSQEVATMVAPHKSPVDYSQRFSGFDKMAEMADSGLSRGELMATGASSSTVGLARRFRRPLKPHELAVAERALDSGETWPKIAADFGIHRTQVGDYAKHLKYRRERGLPVEA